MNAQTPLTLYKLIILYMLNRVSFPLTRTQISDFILGREYTNFLTLQEVFADLAEAEFIRESTMGNRTLMNITEEGRKTLRYFENRIGDANKEEIDAYLNEHKMQLQDEMSIQSRYYRVTGNEYTAELIARDKETVLVSLSLTVPTEEIAQNICDQWQNKNQSIYRYLIEQLF